MNAHQAPPLTSDDQATEEAVERGRLMFARPCKFIIGATKIEHVPDTDMVEIAFAGRSNVGKSSLINAITGHNSLARTSRTPGRTQQINFFDLDGRMMLVDLPGYGYAKASKTSIRGWNKMMQAYMKGRAQLRRLCLLIDSRHGLKPNDKELMTELDETAVSYQAMLTKADRPDTPDIEAVTAEVAEALARHPAAHPEIIVTSSRTGAGIEALRAALTALAEDRRLG